MLYKGSIDSILLLTLVSLSFSLFVTSAKVNEVNVGGD